MTKLDAMNWPSRAALAAGEPSLVAALRLTTAWILDVVAGSAVEDVLPATADQHVIACPAVQRVVAGAADQDVVAVAAIGGELHAAQPGRFDDVIAAKAIDDDAIVGIEAGDRHVGTPDPTP